MMEPQYYHNRTRVYYHTLPDAHEQSPSSWNSGGWAEDGGQPVDHTYTGEGAFTEAAHHNQLGFSPDTEQFIANMDLDITSQSTSPTSALTPPDIPLEINGTFEFEHYDTLAMRQSIDSSMSSGSAPLDMSLPYSQPALVSQAGVHSYTSPVDGSFTYDVMQTQHSGTALQSMYQTTYHSPPPQSHPMDLAIVTAQYSGPWNSANTMRYPGVPRPHDPMFGPQTSLRDNTIPDQSLNYEHTLHGMGGWDSSSPAMAGQMPLLSPVEPTLFSIATSPTNTAESWGTQGSGVHMHPMAPTSQSRQRSPVQRHASIEDSKDVKLINSPASSRGISRQTSDQGQNPKWSQPAPESQEESTSSNTEIPFVIQKFSPEGTPEKSAPPPEARQRQRSGVTKGGRQLGSHLKPESAKDANDRRRDGACWPCVFQRDKCGPGETCHRCAKRIHRPGADYGLQCCRTKLHDLTDCFQPVVWSTMYERKALEVYGDEHINGWYAEPIMVRFECCKNLPALECEMYQFDVKTPRLLNQIKYVKDRRTGASVPATVQSPPLGLTQVEETDARQYDRVVNDWVDKHLPGFVEVCFAEADNDFQTRLLSLMTSLQPTAEDERKLLKETWRLLLVTYIMGHTINIESSCRDRVFSRLRRPRQQGSPTFDKYSFPRMASRQLKYLFASLHRQIMGEVLKKLQQFFKSSKGTEKWTAVFVALLGLAMVHEENQKTITIILDRRQTECEMSKNDADLEADRACKTIDERFTFLTELFKAKYNKGGNPLREQGAGQGRLRDERERLFARDVVALVEEYQPFLYAKATCDGKGVTSRLVGRFLMGFWLNG